MTREERQATRAKLAALVTAYRDTRERTPAETVEALAEVIGKAEALETIATAVNGVGTWDGRVYDYVRTWAAEYPGAISPDDLQEAGIYAPSEIHPAHINQLGQAAMKAGPEG